MAQLGVPARSALQVRSGAVAERVAVEGVILQVWGSGVRGYD